MKISKSLDLLVSVQNILYILCFKKDRIKECKEFVDIVNDHGLFGFMNKNVIE